MAAKYPELPIIDPSREVWVETTSDQGESYYYHYTSQQLVWEKPTDDNVQIITHNEANALAAVTAPEVIPPIKMRRNLPNEGGPGQGNFQDGNKVHGLRICANDNKGVTSLSSVEDSFNDMFDALAQQRLSTVYRKPSASEIWNNQTDVISVKSQDSGSIDPYWDPWSDSDGAQRFHDNSDSDRLEDVFQDEVVNAFVKMVDFKKFARSGRGLSLDEIDVENIVEDNARSVQEQKIQILKKWREKQGSAATAFNIRSLVKKFKDPDSGRDYVELSPEYIIYNDDDALCKELHVYCGEQRSEVTGPRKVAIKLTPLNKRNKKEVEYLIKLSNHQNVLTYIHSGIYNKDPLTKKMYIVTELCRRENLGMLMEANKKLGVYFSESQKKAIAAQFLGGMKYIHSHGIIHRDIKPFNMLISKDGTLIKICDYGLSKSLQYGRSVTNLSILRVGTDGFRAPETYSDDEISQKSDVFSSGLLLYYVVSDGEHAFGKDWDLWNSNIKTGKNLNLSQIHVTEKKQMEKLLKKMLQLDPKKRPTIKDVMEHDVFQHLRTDLQVDDVYNPAANAIVVFDHFDTDHLHSYRPSTNKWTEMQSMCKDTRTSVDTGINFTSVVLGENIYILRSKKMYRLKYSDPTSKWIELQGISENHGTLPSVVAMNGSIYVCGGFNHPSRSVEKYNVASNKWKRMPDMNVARQLRTLAAAQGFIYIIRFDRSVERFNVEDRSFEEVEQTPRSISWRARSVEFEGTLYVADEDGILCYNIENKSWKTMELVQWPKSLLKINIHVVDDELYVVFRYWRSDKKNKIHKLNHKTGCLTLVTTTTIYSFIDTVALRL